MSKEDLTYETIDDVDGKRLVKQTVDGEVLGPNQPIPKSVDQTFKLTVDILAAMTADCQDEVNYFKNWNQKWDQHKAGDRSEGPCLPKA